MRPRVSFVLAVHGEQAYIEQCTQSVLGQGLGDIELIAVDDASHDHGPELLDSLAERDERVTVEHLAERVGPGAARNAGLDRARGDYLWFVEATDRLPAGALAAAVERLDASEADVLVVGHARAGIVGDPDRPARNVALERAADRGPGPIEEHAELAMTAGFPWDKLFRRDLLAAAGARWGTGGHGQLALTWPAFLAAGRVAALPAVSYVRHCPPNAEPPWGSPLDALDHYEAILSRTDLDPAKRELVLGELARHGLMLLDEAAEKDRRALFARLARAYQEHVSGPPRGQWRRVLQSGSYNALRAFDAARAGRRTVARSRRSLERPARRVAGRARRWSLERHYAAERRRPIDPDLAVYAAYWYRGYSCNPRAIYEKARELVPAARGVWVVGPDRVDSLPAGVERVVAGTPEYYTAIARARYLVNNVNFPNHLVKREGSVHVQTHHGTPLKVMGLDQRHAPVSGQKMDFEALARRCARWDYSVSSNPFSTLIWERTYPFRYETLEVGYPRNDALANATPEDALRVREELGIEPGRTAVLYAPTHREWQRRFESPLDLAAVARGLGPDHVVLARVHYFYEADPVLGELHRAGRILDVSAHPSIEELCIASDVLVTDYSSLMFDYGVLDRPIIIYAPDWEVYKALRGVYFDLMAEPPGIVTARQGELIATLRSGDDDPEARAAFRARFCPLDDGRAAERVVRRVWFGERAVAAPQPAALR